LTELRAGNALVVWKLDRLGCSLSHLVRILDELKGRGVAFRSPTEGIDTTTLHGEFLYTLFGTLAQYKRALIRERVNAGLAAARRRGRKGGRLLTLDPETIAQITAAGSVTGTEQRGRRGQGQHALTSQQSLSASMRRLRPEGPKGAAGDEMALKVERVVDRNMHREKTLGRASRLEPLLLALAPMYWLVAQ
jgi:hypothetical protein